MSEEFKDVRIVAGLTIDSDVKEVTVCSLSMTACVARLNFRTRPYQQVTLRLFEDNGDGEISPFKPIKATLETLEQKKSEPEAYYATIKFTGMVNANQGVVQLMKSKPPSDEDNNKPEKPKQKNSLRTTTVSCNLCGCEQIPFRSLQSRSMLSKTNIFGVPTYIEAYPRKDFCDYNLIRVVVCPNCFFASSDVNDFKKKTSKKDATTPTFDIKSISEQWKESISDRKKLVESNLDGFFDEERSIDQALLSFDLGTIATDTVFKASEGKDPRLRNYNMARKSIFYLMIKAEVLMENGRGSEAEKLLKDIVGRLEEVFPYLRNEPSIRSGYLLGMLGLYFEDYKMVGQYLGFLRGFNKDGTVMEGTPEYKALSTSLKNLDEAYQSRDDFSKANLKGFKKPF